MGKIEVTYGGAEFDKVLSEKMSFPCRVIIKTGNGEYDSDLISEPFGHPKKTHYDL